MLESENIATTVPENIIQLHHSFGYDCKRFFNLVLLDDDTLLFASGNLLHYFKISTRQVTFRETVFGEGIGFIIKHPKPEFHDYLVVAENGSNPTVFFYRHPSHELLQKLEGAAEKTFTCGSFNPSGNLLATQAGHPDFMVTIWKWEESKIMLRSKSYQNTVYAVNFSLHDPILLTSCGIAHIKFWKMSDTFTGLKLQGELGRFGKTDISDIYAVYMMADEKVISGCEWGNILVWEAGLIKVEVCRKGRKPCHLRPVTQITMNGTELTTVGMDGYIRIWFWETVELADPPDDDRFVEIQPIYEFYIPNCEICELVKIKPFDKSDYGYYAQDGNGGIWYCDLNTEKNPEDPQKLYSCHGGKVLSIAASSLTDHFLTIGEDGKISLYNYRTEQLLLERFFNCGGTEVLWLSEKHSDSGMDILASFEDGVVRQLFLQLDEKSPKMLLINAIKSHVAAITTLSVNLAGNILVSGSKDKTIFIYSIEIISNKPIQTTPIGFVDLTDIPTAMNWKPDEEATILIGCQLGEIYEINLPTKTTSEATELSYRLELEMKNLKFVSCKSKIRRNVKREATKKRKEEKKKRKLEEIEKKKEANPGIQIDMDAALADSEPEEPEEELYLPEIPNSILWLRYTPNNTIWLSMGGFDAGYIYEMLFGQKKPVQNTLIADGDDIEIYSYAEVKNTLLFGMKTGDIRVNFFKDDFTDLRDYRIFKMHDRLNGVIPRICFSSNGKHLITIGHDGNIFSCIWNGPRMVRSNSKPLIPQIDHEISDIVDTKHPSLEQQKIFDEKKRQRLAAEAKEKQIQDQLAELQKEFDELVEKNNELDESDRLTDKDLELDPRITQEIADNFQAELDALRAGMSDDLEYAQVSREHLINYYFKDLNYLPFEVPALSIKCKAVAKAYRVQELSEEIIQSKKELEERLADHEVQAQEEEIVEEVEKEMSIPEPAEEPFFVGKDQDKLIPKFALRMIRLLNKYRARKAEEIKLQVEWERIQRSKPDPDSLDIKDIRAIEEAEKNMGDYILKTDPNYEPQAKDNYLYKYRDIIACRERILAKQKAYNARVFKARDQKKELYDWIEERRRRFKWLHKLLPTRNHKDFPQIRKMSIDKEYPDQKIVVHEKSTLEIEIKDILFTDKPIKDYLEQKEQEEKALEPTRSAEEDREWERFHYWKVYEVDYIPDPEELSAIIDALPEMKTAEDYEFYARIEAETNPLIIEKRYRWLLELMGEQDTIIHEVNKCAENFDKDLVKLAHLRLLFDFEIVQSETQIITMNLELQILRDGEDIESKLTARAKSAMSERNATQLMLNQFNREIDEMKKNTDRMNEQIKLSQTTFMDMIKGDEFFDFLKRIFKKKYKPPKPPTDDDESSESESSDESSSEEEDDHGDDKSVGSAEIAVIPLDENILPEGCNSYLYNQAFSMRTERQKLEQAVYETTQLIEKKRREMIVMRKTMEDCKDIYNKQKDNLLEFRRKRQLELNKIPSTFILRMDQIQHFNEGEDPEDVSNAILIDSATLKRLKKRVTELKNEDLEIKKLHRANIVHLHRLKKDITHMKHQIQEAEGEIEESMIKKLGMVVDFDELQEAVLRKYIIDLEGELNTDKEKEDEERRLLKKELAVLEEELIQETQMNTIKTNMCTVLQDEVNMMRSVIMNQEKTYEKLCAHKPFNVTNEIEKLKIINRQMDDQLRLIDEEMTALRLENMCPPQLKSSIPAEKVAIVECKVDTKCPNIFDSSALRFRTKPELATMDRVELKVRKFFAQHFRNIMSEALMYKYTPNVARFFSYAAYRFEGELTDHIMDCITEQMEILIPKKYLLHITTNDLRKLFNEVLDIFNYERADVTTEEIVRAVFENSLEMAQADTETLNKTHIVVVEMLKVLVEVQAKKDFESETTLNAIVNQLRSEKLIVPKSISVDLISTEVSKYAQENLIEPMTIIPIRRLAEKIYKEMNPTKPVKKDSRK